jgi:hypothetical protein
MRLHGCFEILRFLFLWRFLFSGRHRLPARALSPLVCRVFAACPCPCRTSSPSPVSSQFPIPSLSRGHSSPVRSATETGPRRFPVAARSACRRTRCAASRRRRRERHFRSLSCFRCLWLQQKGGLDGRMGLSDWPSRRCASLLFSFLCSLVVRGALAEKAGSPRSSSSRQQRTEAANTEQRTEGSKRRERAGGRTCVGFACSTGA